MKRWLWTIVTIISLAACQGDPGTQGDPNTGEMSSEVLVNTAGARPYGTLAMGYNYGCALGRSGGVYCWGDNTWGQLGDGTTASNRLVPVAVTGLSSQVFVAAGTSTSCSVGADGKVRCWGNNSDGELGINSWGGPVGGGYNTPQMVMVSASTPLDTIVEVAVGFAHACARTSIGNVWCWGGNPYGELGDGTTTARYYATHVPGISNVIGLAAGTSDTCALLANHTVSCWGDNEWGQLGNGNQQSSSTPTAVAGLVNVSAIVPQLSGMCALANGIAKCWGRNDAGQMGNGTTSAAQLTPTPVSLSGIASLSRGGYASTTCAVLADGGAKCWGYNWFGQTGSGTSGNNQLTPVSLGATGGSPPNEIAMGWKHGCARTADGNLSCWGSNDLGQLGNNSTTPSNVPVYNQIPQWMSPSQRLAVTAESNSACAISSALGSVACWGVGAEGELGNGTQTARQASPVGVSGLSNVVALAASASTFEALRGDGTVWCWGWNYFGQCAKGTVGDGSGSPSSVTAPVQIPGIAGAVAIEQGCAVISDGTLRCWGSNSYGETGIGNNTWSTQPTPVKVPLTNVIAVAGQSTRCAVRSDGTVWCWGANYGRIGNGTTGDLQLTPTQVTGLTNVVALKGDNGHKCALKSDGTVWCWGSNADGELGDGTTTDRTTPVKVVGLPGSAVAITATRWLGNPGATCAILYDGTVWCWGSNINGQLGNDTTTSAPQKTPVAVSGLANAIEVAVGFTSSYALRADGTLWGWGDNFYGELGIGTLGGTYTTPKQIPFYP
jgi:alpha-tubulin suppressor-like RCC1 family protein